MAIPVTQTGYRDGGKTSEAGIHRVTRGLYTREGVIQSGDLLVTQNGTPDNNVLIATGDIVIGTTSPFTTFPPYFYHSWVATSGLLAIGANASGNGRLDAIVAYFDLSVVSSTNNDNPGVLKFADVQGTAAASPVSPSDATIQAAVGASNPWVLLAVVTVANGFSSIVNANIVDCRPLADTSTTIDTDQSKPFVATGLVWAATAGLSAANSAGRAYLALSGGGGRAMYKPAITHLFTASKDTYVDLPPTAKATTNDDFTYTPVNNGAGAPALASGSIRLAKVVTSGAAVTSVVTSGQDSLGNQFMPKPIGTNQLELSSVGLTNLSSQLQTEVNQGWLTGLGAPTSITPNGNRSYNVVYNGVDKTGTISPGMRLQATRTVAAPTQCTSLNGSTQFYNRTATINGMTFTNNFVVSAWVKLSSYAAASAAIASRFNGTSGWILNTNSSGQVILSGFNGGSGNVSQVTSYQSIPLNRWVHITAQLDMATFTATPTTSYIMIDGIDVVANVARAGTNPTALIQAGNLEIGSENAGAQPFPGKIAQVAIYSAKVTQATILASMNQTLAGNETSLISAYSFNNSINDLNANANNLTANGSAVATNNDTPFTQTQSGVTAGTINYGIVMSASFSTNTTLVVQVPEGDTLPTSGGISAVSYATQSVPFGFPKQRDKWRILCRLVTEEVNAIGSLNTWVASTIGKLVVPIGAWDVGYNMAFTQHSSVSGNKSFTMTFESSAPTNANINYPRAVRGYEAGTTDLVRQVERIYGELLAVQTTFILYGAITAASGAEDWRIAADVTSSAPAILSAECAYL